MAPMTSSVAPPGFWNGSATREYLWPIFSATESPNSLIQSTKTAHPPPGDRAKRGETIKFLEIGWDWRIGKSLPWRTFGLYPSGCPGGGGAAELRCIQRGHHGRVFWPGREGTCEVNRGVPAKHPGWNLWGIPEIYGSLWGTPRNTIKKITVELQLSAMSGRWCGVSFCRTDSALRNEMANPSPHRGQV